jgi:hypothetical protein
MVLYSKSIPVNKRKKQDILAQMFNLARSLHSVVGETICNRQAKREQAVHIC